MQLIENRIYFNCFFVFLDFGKYLKIRTCFSNTLHSTIRDTKNLSKKNMQLGREFPVKNGNEWNDIFPFDIFDDMFLLILAESFRFSGLIGEWLMSPTFSVFLGMEFVSCCLHLQD